MFHKGDELITGYRLEAFLGRGQFGDVWRTTAPGGTAAALKFIDLSGKQGLKEFRGIQRVKEVRHANLMPITALWMLDRDGDVLSDNILESYDRDTADGAIDRTLTAEELEEIPKPQWLVVAMLLGTKSLIDCLEEHQEEGHPGIPVKELLHYMADAAKGIDFLNTRRHDLGEGPAAIQHCDIKPANMMLVGDSVVICDFGLARMLGDVAATATGMVGSPAYMAPECINRKPSAATDQYSLAISYVELRTGQLPFEDATYMGVLEAHRSGNLDLAGLSEAEQEVIRKATHLDPAERFATCTELVEALRKATHSSSVIAAPPLRRTTSIVIVCLILTLIGVGVASLFWPPATVPPPEENPPAIVGGATKQSITLKFVPAGVSVEIDGETVSLDGGQVVLEVESDQALQIAASQGDDFELPEREFTLEQLQEQDFTIELQRTGLSLARAALAKYAAGDVAAAVAEYRRAIGRDAKLAAPTPISLGKHSAAVRALQISADGKWLASASDDGTCHVWPLGDMPPPAPVVLDHHGGEPLECLAIDAGSHWLATGGWDDRVVIRELQEDTLATPTTVANHVGDVVMAAFTADRRWLVSASLDGKLRLWPVADDKVASDAMVLVLGANESEAIDCETFTLGHEGRWLIAIDIDRGLHRWDLRAPDVAGSRKLLAPPGFRVKRCLVRPSTTQLIMVGEAGDAAVLDFALDDGTPVALPGGADDFESLAVDASGLTFLAGTSSGLVYGWRHQDGQFKLDFRLDKHIKPVVDIAITADGKWALSGGWDKAAFLWRLSDAESAASPLLMPGHGNRIHTVAISPTGRWCATGGEDGEVLLWDLPRCQLIQRATEGLQPHGDPRVAWLMTLQSR